MDLEAKEIARENIFNGEKWRLIWEKGLFGHSDSKIQLLGKVLYLK